MHDTEVTLEVAPPAAQICKHLSVLGAGDNDVDKNIKMLE